MAKVLPFRLHHHDSIQSITQLITNTHKGGDERARSASPVQAMIVGPAVVINLDHDDHIDDRVAFERLPVNSEISVPLSLSLFVVYVGRHVDKRETRLAQFLFRDVLTSTILRRRVRRNPTRLCNLAKPHQRRAGDIQTATEARREMLGRDQTHPNQPLPTLCRRHPLLSTT